MKKALTYGSYLQLEELLSLQEPLSEGPEHDEMLFIVIHQVYELWFKEVLHELDYVDRLFAAGDRPSVLHTMKRVLTILKVLVSQLDILETMTPLQFMSFRSRLEAASGFQSYQFRELEFLLGVKDELAIRRFPEGSTGRQALEKRYGERSLWDAFLRFLHGAGYSLSPETLGRDVTRPVELSDDVQDVLLEVYREDPEIAAVCERMVDLDEGIQEWRYRHVKMVERTIGAKRGTGGSSGSEFLHTTLNRPVFPDLWAIRARL
ncbi:MAG: tryptophan 2,3-dioxygenase family protein [Gemmatimonadota bacterium]|nr:MAG: tryptophan 2,3-dioxygenase family protein [Gemmatimonadota bacterium]